MSEDKRQNEALRQFILEHVAEHPHDVTTFTAQAFSLSRPAVLRHIKRLVNDGLLLVSGKTHDRHYALKPLVEQQIVLPITPEIKEDHVWRQHIRPFLKDVSPNVIDMCQYGLTEMLNNVIDHSEGKVAIVVLKCTVTYIRIEVIDDGIGIFYKIQTRLGLDDPRHAVLELAKGKLTTDPEHHTGEGVFFTSRVFDFFSMLSGDLFFAHTHDGDDWLLEQDDSHPSFAGTAVRLEIHPQSSRTLQSVFDHYASEQDDYGFTRTHIPVALAKYGDENLVSRSQAKRLLTRFEGFKEVLLDFKGIEIIGQAFADEIFRVFHRENPHVHVVWTHANEQIERMIVHTRSDD